MLKVPITGHARISDRCINKIFSIFGQDKEYKTGLSNSPAFQLKHKKYGVKNKN
jgi:hypothetical protein